MFFLLSQDCRLSFLILVLDENLISECKHQTVLFVYNIPKSLVKILLLSDFIKKESLL